MLIYTYYLKDIRKAVFWPDRRVFREIPQYLKFGIPGVFLLTLSAYAFVTVNMLSGWISVEV